MFLKEGVYYFIALLYTILTLKIISMQGWTYLIDPIVLDVQKFLKNKSLFAHY